MAVSTVEGSRDGPGSREAGGKIRGDRPCPQGSGAPRTGVGARLVGRASDLDIPPLGACTAGRRVTAVRDITSKRAARDGPPETRVSETSPDTGGLGYGAGIFGTGCLGAILLIFAVLPVAYAAFAAIVGGLVLVRIAKLLKWPGNLASIDGRNDSIGTIRNFALPEMAESGPTAQRQRSNALVPRRGGRSRRDSAMRKFSDPDRDFRDRWDLLD